MTRTVRVKRVYDEPDRTDGTRVLVDRLWPRGISKEKAEIDTWAKDVTPSSALRTWYHHAGPDEAAEFGKRYRAELAGDEQREGLRRLRALLARGPVTLVTAVKDPEHSHVSVLLDTLRDPS